MSLICRCQCFSGQFDFDVVSFWFLLIGLISFLCLSITSSAVESQSLPPCQIFPLFIYFFPVFLCFCHHCFCWFLSDALHFLSFLFLAFESFQLNMKPMSSCQLLALIFRIQNFQCSIQSRS